MGRRERHPSAHSSWCEEKEKLPEELVNAGLAEGALQQSKFHFACVDGRHGGIAEPADAERGLQLHLSAGFGPQPADGGREWDVKSVTIKSFVE